MNAAGDNTTGSLTVPIRLGAVLRLEPEFGGVYSRSTDRTSTTWGYTFGVGIAASWGTGATRPVVGLRVGTQEAGSKTSTVKDAIGGLYLGGVLGLEHFLTDVLSIGAEGRFTYTAAEGGGVVAGGTIAVRIYFN